MQPNDPQPSTDGNNATPVEPTTPNTDVLGQLTEETQPEAPAVLEPSPTPAITDVPAPAVPEVLTAETPSPATEATVIPPVDKPTPVVGGSSGLPTTQMVTGSQLGKQGSPKKIKLFAGIIGLAVLLVGGTAGAYFGVIAPNKPQRIVQDSLANTVNGDKTKSGMFEGELACVEGDACKTVSAVNFKGAADKKGSFDLNAQVKTVVTSIGLDVRSVGDKSIYLRLSGLDGLDKLLGSLGGEANMAAQYAPIISKINNQWYTVDDSLLKQAGGSLSLPSTDTKFSDADAKKLGDAYRNHQFIKIDKKLADEKIHDQSSYHIQASIDKTQFKAFATEVKSANIKDLKIEQKDIDAIDKVDLAKYPFDLWVNKSNRMISQVSTTVKQDGTTFKFRMAIYGYNKPVTVEKPAGAKSVLELVSEFAPLYSGGVQGANSENPLSLTGL